MVCNLVRNKRQEQGSFTSPFFNAKGRAPQCAQNERCGGGCGLVSSEFGDVGSPAPFFSGQLRALSLLYVIARSRYRSRLRSPRHFLPSSVRSSLLPLDGVFPPGLASA